uniref:U29-Deinotoxin-Dsu1a_1 n=1 Tax=Deinopis subrufa TaxID=1905329 RepID=A0A4Q8K9C4_DEISU
MNLLLPILFTCTAVLVFANAELDDFNENAPAYGSAAVEERSCGKYGDLCGSYGNWRDCCSNKFKCSCYNEEVFKKTCKCDFKSYGRK